MNDKWKKMQILISLFIVHRFCLRQILSANVQAEFQVVLWVVLQ